MDIVERLRTQGIKHPQQLEHWRDEAADEIERLRAELEAVKKERDELRQYGRVQDPLLEQLTTCQQQRDEFEEHRNAAWAELRKIRVALGANMEESTADEAERIKQQRDELAAAAQMAVEMIETKAHERRHVRWKLKDALAKLGADKTGDVG